MFTGIIEGLGKVAAINATGSSKRMSFETEIDLSGSQIGDSFAVNGACLTAVSLDKHRFAVDISPESIERTTLGTLVTGEVVNIERALRLSDRLDGHLVSGHIDGIGALKSRKTQGNVITIGFTTPHELSRYLVEKGSIAVDGISLTINTVERDGFTVCVIPHTAKMTTLQAKSVGDAVNIETDMIGKYVERFLSSGRRGNDYPAEGRTTIDEDFLSKTGFI